MWWVFKIYTVKLEGVKNGEATRRKGIKTGTYYKSLNKQSLFRYFLLLHFLYKLVCFFSNSSLLMLWYCFHRPVLVLSNDKNHFTFIIHQNMTTFYPRSKVVLGLYMWLTWSKYKSNNSSTIGLFKLYLLTRLLKWYYSYW